MVKKGIRPQYVGYVEILYPRIPFAFFTWKTTEKSPEKEENKKINQKMTERGRTKPAGGKNSIVQKRISSTF